MFVRKCSEAHYAELQVTFFFFFFFSVSAKQGCLALSPSSIFFSPVCAYISFFRGCVTSKTPLSPGKRNAGRVVRNKNTSFCSQPQFYPCNSDLQYHPEFKGCFYFFRCYCFSLKYIHTLFMLELHLDMFTFKLFCMSFIACNYLHTSLLWLGFLFKSYTKFLLNNAV